MKIDDISFETQTFSWLDDNSYKKFDLPKRYPAIVLSRFTRWNDFGLENIHIAVFFRI